MTDKTRADFEAWYYREYNSKPDDFKLFPDGEMYLDPTLNADWDVWQAATLAEREACAKICDAMAVHPEYASDVTKIAALAIRARN